MTQPPPEEPRREDAGPWRPPDREPDPTHDPHARDPYGPDPRSRPYDVPPLPHAPPPQEDVYGADPRSYDPARYGGPPWMELGGRWARLFAAIVDAVIVNVVCSVVASPFNGWGGVYGARSTDGGSQTAADVVTVVIAFLYYWIQHAMWGQTLGKRLFRLRVVNEFAGGRIGWGMAAWRLLFVYIISVVTCGIMAIVDVAWILWDRRKQALHDKVARTLVVKATPGSPNPYAR